MTSASQAAPVLRTLDDIKAYLKDSPQPVFYVSRSATNLLGVDRVASGFHYVTLSDSWDGKHPRAFAPTNVPKIEPRGNIAVSNWLLRNDQVQAYIAKHTPTGMRPQVVIAMFDATTEQLCAELGYELIMPSIALRERLDSKIVTTQVGNDAGTPSVPNILTTISGWDDLRAQAEAAGLGERLVIQLPYGDSGRTTYFVSAKSDYDEVASSITGSGSTAPQIKVMRYINHQPLATEAVITRAGTVVGPVLREVTGHPELTRYQGGWAGSEMYPSLVDDETRGKIIDMVRRFCDRLGEEGYRGVLEVSTLLDTDTGDVYLGELNPRISGSSAHSNLQGLSTAPGSTETHPTLPLFAFHLLEYSGAEFELDLDAIQAEREAAVAGQTWGTLVMQQQRPGTERVIEAPRTGRYRILADDSLEFISADLDWQEISEPDEAFWFRSSGVGEVIAKGVDVGMLITRRRSQEEHYALTEPTKRLIPALLDLYRGKPMSTVERYWRAGVRRLRGE